MTKLVAALAEVREAAEKSDLRNLAHAILAIDQEIARLMRVKTEIIELAEQDYRPASEVRRLYDVAHGRREK